jgi:peptidoglycan/LPS O-acetylase OafA/YrhL
VKHRRRNRLLVGAGVLSFLVCVPLVSLPDGTALSVIGLCLAAVAGACVISLVYLLAGEGEQADPERDPEE